MTPEEQAKAIYESMRGFRVKTHHIKKCALACVQHIIDAYPTTVETFNNSKGLNVVHVDNRDYWNDVKTEIDKL
tara:strand:- start:3740 stop:3961 length:222 start_codon:yes stop_codon:yes gene_type:complete